MIESNIDKCSSWLENSNHVSNGKTCEDGEGLPDNHNSIACENAKTDILVGSETSTDLDQKRPISNGTSLLSESSLPDNTEPRGSKRSSENEELKIDNKKCRTVIIDSDDETDTVKNVSSCNVANVEPQSDSKQNICNSGAHSLPLRSPNEIFYCTACNKIAAEVHQHPLLKVIICQDCRCLMEKKKHIKVEIIYLVLQHYHCIAFPLHLTSLISF